MARIIRSVFGVGLVVAGILIVGVGSALADSTSQTTTLNLTVPSSISLTGLAASYTATVPAGTIHDFNTGPVTVATNATHGWTLTLAAGSADFNGPVPFPISADVVRQCDASFSTCGSFQALTMGGVQVAGGSTPTAGDTFGVQNEVTVPSSVSAGLYTLSILYTATAQP